MDLALTKFDLHPILAPVLVLIGAPGAGKTTIGAALAQRLGAQFIDTDQVIQLQTGLSVGSIFNDYGEPIFRRLETGVVDALLAKKVVPGEGEGGAIGPAECDRSPGSAQTVVSTGAGLAVQPGNFEKLESLGTIICLTAPIAVLAERLSQSEVRPLIGQPTETKQSELSQASNRNLERLRTLLAARAAIYARARLQIDAEDANPEQIVDRILHILPGLG